MNPNEEFAERIAEEVRYWVAATLSGGTPEIENSSKAPIALQQVFVTLSEQEQQIVKDAIAFCAQGVAFSILVGLDGDSNMAAGFKVAVSHAETGESVLGDLHDEIIGRFMVSNEWVG